MPSGPYPNHSLKKNSFHYYINSFFLLAPFHPHSKRLRLRSNSSGKSPGLSSPVPVKDDWVGLMQITEFPSQNLIPDPSQSQEWPFHRNSPVVCETLKTAWAAVQSWGYLDATATNPFFIQKIYPFAGAGNRGWMGRTRQTRTLKMGAALPIRLWWWTAAEGKNINRITQEMTGLQQTGEEWVNESVF